ncbi:phosphotransferase [Plantactinospora sp. GCM10030261]|uniref:phosphotransferase n=1 Tax=Plantactinospora sp. GCM10030261 TaxID=3273420 RepID=UPI00361C7B2A
MRDRPAKLTDVELTAALAEGWAIETRSVAYLPVGFGSYHWRAVEPGGRPWFVKVDDLGVREAARDETFDRLARAFGTTLALREDAGLDFVVAPVRTRAGATVSRLSSRYALSVFPLLDGSTGQFGPHRPDDRAEVVDLLAELHRATPIVAETAPRADLTLPGRDRLDEALRGLDQEWTGGPYAEPTRALLAVHGGHVERLLADFDRLVEQVRAGAADWVVTHGEPHPGNLLRTSAGVRLIDWETVLIAPAERDLWMCTDAFARLVGEEPAGDTDETLARYHRDTGRLLTPAGLDLYALWWKLADIAAYVDELRRPHGRGEDITASFGYLTGYLETGSD